MAFLSYVFYSSSEDVLVKRAHFLQFFFSFQTKAISILYILNHFIYKLLMKKMPSLQCFLFFFISPFFGHTFNETTLIQLSNINELHIKLKHNQKSKSHRMIFCLTLNIAVILIPIYLWKHFTVEIMTKYFLPHFMVSLLLYISHSLYLYYSNRSCLLLNTYYDYIHLSTKPICVNTE